MDNRTFSFVEDLMGIKGSKKLRRPGDNLHHLGILRMDLNQGNSGLSDLGGDSFRVLRTDYGNPTSADRIPIFQSAMGVSKSVLRNRVAPIRGKER
jgi:hypothetical protein